MYLFTLVPVSGVVSNRVGIGKRTSTNRVIHLAIPDGVVMVESGT